jgi:SnoaL-like domain
MPTPAPRNGLWFPKCGGDPEPGVADFSDLDYRDSIETQHQSTVRDFIQKVWNGKDSAAVDAAINALVDMNYKRHYEAKLLQGRENFKKCVRLMHGGLADFYITVLRMVPSYNMVGASVHIRWFDGTLHEMRGIEMYRLQNDLIAESWHAAERAGHA